MGKLLWDDHKSYVALHAKLRGWVAVGLVCPLKGQCPRKRDYCDRDEESCRAFGGILNVESVVAGDEAVILCAEAKDANPELVAQSKQRSRGC